MLQETSSPLLSLAFSDPNSAASVHATAQSLHPIVQGAYYNLLMGNWTLFLWAVATIATGLGAFVVFYGTYELFVWILYLIYEDEIKSQQAEYKLRDSTSDVIPVIRS